MSKTTKEIIAAFNITEKEYFDMLKQGKYPDVCDKCGHMEIQDKKYRLEASLKYGTSCSVCIKEKAKYVPKCPTCQSPDLKMISDGDKILSGCLFGLFSTKIRKTYHCNTCKYEW